MGLLSNKNLLTEKENIAKKGGRPQTSQETQMRPKQQYHNTPRKPQTPVLNGPRPSDKFRASNNSVLQSKNTSQRVSQSRQRRENRSTPVKFTALGGLNEIGNAGRGFGRSRFHVS